MSTLLVALVLGCSGSKTPDRNLPTDTAGNEYTEDGNRLPRVTDLAFDPETPTVSDRVGLAVEVVDADGDPLEFEYQWTVNGRTEPTLNLESLDPGTLKKGDTFQVEITISDGKDKTVINSPQGTIANSPPEVTVGPADLSSINGFVVAARDADGDELSWSLSGQPPGMSIDGGTGELSYEGSTDSSAGDFRAVVVVRDTDGATATWEMGLSLEGGRLGEQPQQAQAEPVAAEPIWEPDVPSTNQYEAADQAKEFTTRDEGRVYETRNQGRVHEAKDNAREFEARDEANEYTPESDW